MSIAKVILLSAFTLIAFHAIIVFAKCSKVYELGVDQNNANIIVNKHNYLRSLVARGQIWGQPKATNFGNMQWDKGLANAAQNIANTCRFEHMTVNDGRWSWVGQNLFITTSTSGQRGPEWDRVIQSWFDEHTNFRYPDISTGQTGHYTQIVSDRSKFIGCGYTMYQDYDRFSKLYVCNYGPGGNIIGRPPYNI